MCTADRDMQVDCTDLLKAEHLGLKHTWWAWEVLGEATVIHSI